MWKETEKDRDIPTERMWLCMKDASSFLRFCQRDLMSRVRKCQATARQRDECEEHGIMSTITAQIIVSYCWGDRSCRVDLPGTFRPRMRNVQTVKHVGLLWAAKRKSSHLTQARRKERYEQVPERKSRCCKVAALHFRIHASIFSEQVSFHLNRILEGFECEGSSR